MRDYIIRGVSGADTPEYATIFYGGSRAGMSKPSDWPSFRRLYVDMLDVRRVNRLSISTAVAIHAA